ncbi:hypothetical protein [Agrobacterium cavarae]|uniref:hypothetical protein n=1 Tax=Agrobacterium cavarae TaxID=2528239 RepID=UPI0011A107C4|nr:hypothetical protein [Agrobacterium cavarae]
MKKIKKERAHIDPRNNIVEDMRPINDTITSTQIALIQMASAHLKDLMRAMAGVGTGGNTAGTGFTRYQKKPSLFGL